jgi:excisionase family DNA binding protein
MIEKFLTTEQVANILQVHPFTILKFIKQKKLRGVKLGRVYRIKESDVHQFLDDSSTHKAEQPKKTEEQPIKTKKTEEGEGDDHFYII